jgi:hypothetical protein
MCSLRGLSSKSCRRDKLQRLVLASGAFWKRVRKRNLGLGCAHSQYRAVAVKFSFLVTSASASKILRW